MNLPAADPAIFPIDGNDIYGDCVVASTAHLFYVLFDGKVIPLDTVLKDFKGWCNSGGCTVGWFMWQLWWNGMNGCRMKQFCKLAPTQSDVDWAVKAFGGCIICIFNGQHQAAIVGKLPDGRYRVVVWGLNGWIKDLAWEDIAGGGDTQLQLAPTGHFAMSTTYRPTMLWYSLKNNLITQTALAMGTALSGYAAYQHYH